MRIFDAADRLRGALDYHLARHNVLTSNLAHVDTPNYKPLDVERRDAFEGAMGLALRATDPRHIGVGSGAQTPHFKVVEDKGAPVGLDGNAVSVDREAVKIASNNIRYETLSTLVGDELAGLSWAANDGRNG
jgi:flagellar basal-body rod protein FlgB